MVTGLGDVTEPAAINELLANYRVPSGARATILEATAAARSDGITVIARADPGGGLVTLGPEDGAMAISVQPNRVRIVLDRRQGVRASQEHEFSRIDDPDAGPGRVQLAVEPWALEQHAVVVRRLLRAALLSAVPPTEPTEPGPAVRSSVGRTRTAARPARAAQPPEAPRVQRRAAVCAIHFVELVNGHCDYCD